MLGIRTLDVQLVRAGGAVLELPADALRSVLAGVFVAAIALGGLALPIALLGLVATYVESA